MSKLKVIKFSGRIGFILLFTHAAITLSNLGKGSDILTFNTIPSVSAEIEKENVYLFPIKVNGKYGYINKNGQVVIKPQFFRGFLFTDGRAKIIQDNQRWLEGFIDKNGFMVIKPQFTNSGFFSEGLASVKVGEKWGFIDKNGRMVIKPQFDGTSVSFFKEGLAPIKIGSKYGFIDKSGKLVIPTMYEDATIFSEGLAGVKLLVYKAKDGTLTPNPQFSRSDIISGVLSNVQIQTKWGFIDRNGNVVIEPQFDKVRIFYRGESDVEIDGIPRTIDKTGKAVTTPPNTNFYEGFIAVKIGQKWGFLDESGRVVIPPQFDFAYNFSNGLAPVKVRDKWGLIDKSGTFIFVSQYEELFIIGNLAVFKANGKWGLIDKRTRKIIVYPQFDEAPIFINGLAEVTIGKKSGYIDENGRYVWKPSE